MRVDGEAHGVEGRESLRRSAAGELVAGAVASDGAEGVVGHEITPA